MLDFNNGVAAAAPNGCWTPARPAAPEPPMGPSAPTSIPPGWQSFDDSFVQPDILWQSAASLLTCKITGALLDDPVVAADGYAYSRQALQPHIAGPQGHRSPVTGYPVAEVRVVDSPLLSLAVAAIQRAASGALSGAQFRETLRACLSGAQPGQPMRRPVCWPPAECADLPVAANAAPEGPQSGLQGCPVYPVRALQDLAHLLHGLPVEPYPARLPVHYPSEYLAVSLPDPARRRAVVKFSDYDVCTSIIVSWAWTLGGAAIVLSLGLTVMSQIKDMSWLPLMLGGVGVALPMLGWAIGRAIDLPPYLRLRQARTQRFDQEVAEAQKAALQATSGPAPAPNVLAPI